MKKLSYIVPKELARLDVDQIDTLWADLGSAGAEEVMCRAMEDLGSRLCRIHDRALSGPREDLHRELRAISAVAEQIGLSGLSHVARCVMDAVEMSDPVAEAATMSRLSRVGERSLTELWDMQGVSI